MGADVSPRSSGTSVHPAPIRSSPRLLHRSIAEKIGQPSTRYLHRSTVETPNRDARTEMPGNAMPGKRRVRQGSGGSSSTGDESRSISRPQNPRGATSASISASIHGAKCDLNSIMAS